MDLLCCLALFLLSLQMKIHFKFKKNRLTLSSSKSCTALRVRTFCSKSSFRKPTWTRLTKDLRQQLLRGTIWAFLDFQLFLGAGVTSVMEESAGAQESLEIDGCVS